MNGLEKKFREQNSYPVDITEYDDNAKYLIGWPGYRTSNNKSGLGYLETQSELAHMQGVMFRWMITGKFRTHNPFYLLGMTLIGIFYGGIPVFLILHEVFIGGNWLMLLVFVTAFPNIAVGILLLVNVVLSILDWNGKTITGD
jgi:hypothetical protein